MFAYSSKSVQLWTLWAYTSGNKSGHVAQKKILSIHEGGRSISNEKFWTYPLRQKVTFKTVKQSFIANDKAQTSGTKLEDVVIGRFYFYFLSGHNSGLGALKIKSLKGK